MPPFVALARGIIVVSFDTRTRVERVIMIIASEGESARGLIAIMGEGEGMVRDRRIGKHRDGWEAALVSDRSSPG